MSKTVDHPCDFFKVTITFSQKPEKKKEKLPSSPPPPLPPSSEATPRTTPPLTSGSLAYSRAASDLSRPRQHTMHCRHCRPGRPPAGARPLRRACAGPRPATLQHSLRCSEGRMVEWFPRRMIGRAKDPGGKSRFCQLVGGKQPDSEW